MKQQKAFTLIELLVTMTIVAVLAALALVSLQGSRKGARDARRKADLEEIRAALEMCWADTGSYILDIYVGSPAALVCGSNSYLTTPYDPTSGGVVEYYYLSTGSTYNLCARLEVGGTTLPSNVCGTANRGCNNELCNYRVTQP